MHANLPNFVECKQATIINNVTYLSCEGGRRTVVEAVKRRAGRLHRVAAIEVKCAERWNWSWEKPLRSLVQSSVVKVDRIVGVYCGSRSYFVDDLQVWPHAEFAKALYTGEIF